MSWEPMPVPLGDGRHDIGDDVRSAIVERLTSDWLRDPDLAPEKARQLALWAGASVRGLLHELGTLRGMASDPTEPHTEEWAPYLKDGESPLACLLRHRADADAVLSLLAQEKQQLNAAEQRADTLHQKLEHEHETSRQAIDTLAAELNAERLEVISAIARKEAAMREAASERERADTLAAEVEKLKGSKASD